MDTLRDKQRLEELWATVGYHGKRGKSVPKPMRLQTGGRLASVPDGMFLTLTMKRTARQCLWDVFRPKMIISPLEGR